MPKVLSSTSPTVSAVPFPAEVYTPGPKVPVYVVEVPSICRGSALLVQGEVTLNYRSFGKSTFAASQLRLLSEPPTTNGLFLPGVALSAANGSNLNAMVPYGVIAKSGLYWTDEDLGPQWVAFYVWVSSEAATTTDSIQVVPGYGRLDVLLLS